MARKHTFGERLRRYRERAELTQGELALHARIVSGRTSIDNWEKDAAVPSSKWIVPLADALGVSCDELLRGEP